MKPPVKNIVASKPRAKRKPGLPVVAAAAALPPVALPAKRVGRGNPKGTRPPNAGKGRGKGAVNVVTRIIKEATIAAAAAEGADGHGKDGLEGYLRRLARNEPRSFASLLGRIIPVQIGTDPDHPLSIIISADDARIG